MSYSGGGICCLAWKERSGLGKFRKIAWEQRWIVVAGTFLSYYQLGEEDKQPRGSLDLSTGDVKIQVKFQQPPLPPTPEEIDDLHGYVHKPTTPTPNEVDIIYTAKKYDENDATATTNHNNKDAKWRFCFETQDELMTFVSAIHNVLDVCGSFKQLDANRFEHDFLPGDHIYRWEMIVCPPVIYPIQIHGIVLDAGRNCVVIADFGLTGYSKKEGNEFNHVDDHTSNVIVAAFKKLRPKHSNQRLNIDTLTDPYDIRKWTKANYESHSKNKHYHPNMMSNLKSFGSSRSRTNSTDGDVHVTNATNSSHNENDTQQVENNNLHNLGQKFSKFFKKTSPLKDEIQESTSSSSSQQQQQSSSSPRQKSKSAASQQQDNKEQPHVLPKSDPVDIVLARANFLLEHGNDVGTNYDDKDDDNNKNGNDKIIIPPYHVFYSNSECIAVWCKTGRWSTIQTAVFLSTTSVSAAKSSTLAVMGVAAANVLFAPVVAVGGLLCISAPMVILQKSKEKWAEYTASMNDQFWERAEPSIYISAIKNWCTKVDIY